MTAREIPFTASDLIVTPEGRIYHLDLKPEELAPNIIIVGDPGRALTMAKQFLISTEIERVHRGLVSVTGTVGITNKRVSFITSGMGTPSLEIILSELVALNEINFETREPKSEFKKLNIIRVGTCGSLQANTKLGTAIISSHAIGLDNTGLFYDSPAVSKDCERIESELAEVLSSHMKESRFRGWIRPYVAEASNELFNLLCKHAERDGLEHKCGITVSNSGFFANQGRHIARISPSLLNIDQVLGSYDPKLDGTLIENMEMESSFLFHFINGLGHRAASICPTIAHRVSNTFADNYNAAVLKAGEVALKALAEADN